MYRSLHNLATVDEEQSTWLQSVPEDKLHRSEVNVRLYKAHWAEEAALSWRDLTMAQNHRSYFRME